jgi:transcriptional regulator with XRE-family HTH domain
MKTPSRKTIEAMIRKLREEYSLTQREIAHLTGLSEATVSRIINGVDTKTLVYGTVLFLGLSFLFSRVPPPPKDEAAEEKERRRPNKLKGVSGRRLKLMRVEMDLTQLQLAKYLGVSEGSISRWENGIVKIEYLPIITLAMMEVRHLLEQRQELPEMETRDTANVLLKDLLAEFA